MLQMMPSALRRVASVSDELMYPDSGVPRSQMTLMYSNPALCAVFAWVLGTEAVTCTCLAGVLATVVGVVLIAQPPFLFGLAAWDHTRLLGARPHVSARSQVPGDFGANLTWAKGGCWCGAHQKAAPPVRPSCLEPDAPAEVRACKVSTRSQGVSARTV